MTILLQDAFVLSLAFIIGVLSMLVSTFSGGGTNVMLIPILILVYHFSAGEAIGTAFLALLAGSIIASIKFVSLGQANVRFAVRFGLLMIPGIALGTFLSMLTYEPILKFTLGIVITALSVLILWSSSNRETGKRPETTKYKSKLNLQISIVMSLMVGFFVGFFGQGGGLLLLPVMQLAGLPLLQAIGTARIVAILIGTTSFAFRFALGQVDLEIGAFLALGAMVGGLTGVKLAIASERKLLGYASAACVALLGILLTLSSLQ